mgnify:FL=1
MAKYRNNTIRCPYCGRDSKMQQYPIVRLSDTREMDKALSANLFTVKCRYCNEVFEEPYDTCFIDRTDEKLILCVADDNLEVAIRSVLHHTATSEDFEYELAELAEECLEEGYDIRLTRDKESFSEKILAHLEDIDDRIIEIAKYIYLTLHEKELNDCERLVFNKGFDYSGRGHYLFMPFYDGAPGENYAELGDYFADTTEEAYRRYLDHYEGDSLEVDQKWVSRFLEFVAEHEHEYDDEEEDWIDYTKEADPEIAPALNLLRSINEQDYQHEEVAKELIINHFEEIMKQLLDYWYKDHKEKPTIDDMNYDNSTEFDWFVNDFSMYLNNCGEYAWTVKIADRILESFDFSDDYLTYHNLRRDRIESVGKTEGKEKWFQLLEEWDREEPENPYIYGSILDYYCLHGEYDQAKKFAEKCMALKVKRRSDEWMYDALENLADDLKDQKMKKEIEKKRKAERNQMQGW